MWYNIITLYRFGAYVLAPKIFAERRNYEQKDQAQRHLFGICSALCCIVHYHWSEGCVWRRIIRIYHQRNCFAGVLRVVLVRFSSLSTDS